MRGDHDASPGDGVDTDVDLVDAAAIFEMIPTTGPDRLVSRLS